MAEGVTTQKLCVYINNLPEDLKRSALLSEVKSTRSKNSSKNALGASRRSLNIAESTVKEK